ncbi:ATP synthase subunit I [Alkaliphilus sp. B6464]|uniref:ATP synthase subunit I n=1 Tax=Alkaliphilus sp. B6464 TaxID=2731219 RepID=UPI001BADA549|nr:ATP synthase subunit I [Alkaliphilus sp. B6464]QUH19097.1 ATP synthase subunit I [Alkaliphilus sp. B6464]
MESLQDLQLKLIKGVLIFNIIVGVGSIFIFDPWVPFITGQVFGMIISILNFRLLSLTLQTAIKMESAKAQVYVGSRYVIRFLLMGVVLFISIKADYINVLGTIIGLISLKLIILITQVFSNLQFFKTIIKRKEVK